MISDMVLFSQEKTEKGTKDEDNIENGIVDRYKVPKHKNDPGEEIKKRNEQTQLYAALKYP